MDVENRVIEVVEDDMGEGYCNEYVISHIYSPPKSKALSKSERKVRRKLRGTGFSTTRQCEKQEVEDE